MKFVTLVCSLLFCLPSFAQEKFPDGTLIPDWFRQNEIVNIETLGGKYKITDHGVVNDSTLLQTEKIQACSGCSAARFLRASFFWKRSS